MKEWKMTWDEKWRKRDDGRNRRNEVTRKRRKVRMMEVKNNGERD